MREAAVHEVTVRHIVEYRPTQLERSGSGSEALRHTYPCRAPLRTLAITSLCSVHEDEIESVCSKPHQCVFSPPGAAFAAVSTFRCPDDCHHCQVTARPLLA